MKIAIIGAAGLVGREMLSIMAERDFPKDSIVALDKREFLHKELDFGYDHTIKVKPIDGYDFTGTDIAILAISGNEAKRMAPAISSKGTYVIDTSEAFTLEPDVPLVVAGLNDEAVAKYNKRRIIASPSPVALMLADTLAAFDKAVGLKRASVVAMNATSAFGKEAMDELFSQTKGVFMNASIEETRKVFPKQIAFNVIPFTGAIMKDGFLQSERLVKSELEKILGSGTVVNINEVVIPSFIGSCAYIMVELKKSLSVKEATAILEQTSSVTVFTSTNEEGYATPAEISGEDNVFISRLKLDETVPNGLNMFAVMDTMRTGLALNSVKLAELLVDKYLS